MTEHDSTGRLSAFHPEVSCGLAAPTGDRRDGGAPADGGRTECSRASRPQEAAGFVREAVAADLQAIGSVHAATMLASLSAAHASAHAGADLPEGVAAMIAPPVLTAGWEGPVVDPPSPAHHVLVSVLGEEVVGLVAVAPTQGVVASRDGTVDGSGDPQPAAEITAIGVSPEHQRHGHGSRLLAAATDLARADGAHVVVLWAVRGDDSLSRLLTAAGLERTESHRELPVGAGVTEDCWIALL